jgi:erythronate-4-phosphate dehydrogenase
VKIVVDDKIPYIAGALEPFAEVVYLEGRRTGAADVRDADALVTRTRTRCDRSLLEGSRVRFIATATIGFDHIDTEFCRQAGIEWSNAPGCNAESVNQYMASCLFSLSERTQRPLAGQTIGIVGVGQVGSRVARTCERLGMRVLLNDPPRARREGDAGFVSLEQVRAESDFISFHVPLNMAGQDRTLSMVDDGFCASLGRRPVLFNTCRGEVFETAAVSGALQSGALSGLVLDCWENEPGIDLDLLGRVDFGTPHIAGYSRDGKANGTRTSVRAISRFFGLGIDDWEPKTLEAPSRPVIALSGTARSTEAWVAEAVLATYRIETDDRMLRADPAAFERLRGDYPVRREFGAYTVQTADVPEDVARLLSSMGFRCAGKGRVRQGDAQ